MQIGAPILKKPWLYDIDGENKENKLFLKEFNIKEYPTIILLKNNKKYIFDAKLEKNRLLEFLKAVNNL